MKNLIRGWILLLSFSIPLGAVAQTDLDSTLEDLLDIKSSIAAKREMTPRESPGILTLVTREDIVRSGARDLAEILTLFVPGFNFASDVENVVGLNVRGIWGDEGRVLLLMDGMEMHEELFGTTQFGNHYPAEIIEKVEVIRGPGSVIYGGNAQIGVVNVVTRAADHPQMVVAERYSGLESSASHNNFTAGIGQNHETFKYDIMATTGHGNRSQFKYTDTNLNEYDTKDKIHLDPTIVNFGLTYGDFSARGIFDRYNTTHLQLHSVFPPGTQPYEESFENHSFQAQYKGKVSDTLTITPRYLYRETYPYRVNADSALSKYSERSLLGVTGDYRMTDEFGLLGGVEWSTVKIKMKENWAAEPPFNYGKKELSDEFVVAFAESNLKTEIGNLTAGARFEKPNNYRSALVPRLSLTRAWEHWHYKAMVSQSYRAPGYILPNRTVTQEDELKSEVATNYEFEVGHKFNENLFMVFNFFDISIKDPLYYIVDPSGSGGYDNAGTVGSTGAEAELKYRLARFDAMVNLAYHQRAHAEENNYGVPKETTYFYGVPQIRLNSMVGYRFTNDFGVYPSISYYGKRYGLVGAGGDTTKIEEASPTTVMNINFRYTNLFMEGIEASAGIMNITDENIKIYQAYNGGFAAIPGLGRAYNVMVSYTEKF